MPESRECSNRIISEDYIDLILNFLVEPEDRNMIADYCNVEVDSNFTILYINSADLPPISAGLYGYDLLPKCYTLTQDTEMISDQNSTIQSAVTQQRIFDTNSLSASGIIRVQNPPLELTGRGCIIAFIDTGIRYENKVFRNPDGSSRILSIWDQTIESEFPPEGFLYGTEYTREQINEALTSEFPRTIVPSTDEIGHGSNLASIAAGSKIDGGRTFLGAAYDADIVVVKLRQAKKILRDYYLIRDGVPCYSESDIMLALKYVQSYIQTFRRPVVICFGLGSSMGDHGGNTALAGYMDGIARRKSCVVVCSSGNEGNAAHHFSGSLRTEQNHVEIRVGEGVDGIYMEFWGQIPNFFSIAVRAPSGEQINSVPLQVGSSLTYRFLYEKTQLSIDNVLTEGSSGKQLVIFRFVNPAAGIWSVDITADLIFPGEFDIWLPVTAFLTGEVTFLEPNPYTTLISPSSTDDVITLSGYQDSTGGYYVDSGRGYTADQRIKPDMAAPAVNVPAAYTNVTGCSAAAAITSGATAQIMQWAVVEQNAPVVSGIDIKNYFIRGASRRSSDNYPNRETGYGYLDLVGTFQGLAMLR